MALSRRNFLKASAAVVGGCIVVGGGGYLALDSMGRPVSVEKNADLEFMMDEEVKEVLYCASLAPSSHNIQNWLVGASPEKGELNIYLDRQRALPAIDPERKEPVIAIGAFTQNLIEAFESSGYRSDIALNEDKDHPLCATLSYTKAASFAPKTSAFDVFSLRHSDKSAFKKEALPESILSKLLTEHGSAVHYYSGSGDDGSFLAETTLKAFIQQSNDQEARDELAQWLRFSDAETRERKDGLPAEQLGLSGFMKTFYYLTTNRESASGDTFAQQGIDKARTQLDGCAGFFLVTGGEGKRAWLETGMRLEAFWLDATRAGIAIHPMSAALQERPFKQEVTERFGQGKSVHMILRAGLSGNYGKNAGIRRDLNEFMFLEN